ARLPASRAACAGRGAQADEHPHGYRRDRGRRTRILLVMPKEDQRVDRVARRACESAAAAELHDAQYVEHSKADRTAAELTLALTYTSRRIPSRNFCHVSLRATEYGAGKCAFAPRASAACQPQRG